MKFFKRHKNYLIGFYVFLLLVQFFIKDTFFPISIIFYAFPILIIVIYNFLLIYIDKKNKYLQVSLIIILSIFLFKNYKTGLKEEIKTSNLKVLYWNIAKKKDKAIPILVNAISTENPDIISLVEAKGFSTDDIKNLEGNLSNYYFKKLKGSIVVGLKIRKSEIEYTELIDSSKFNLVSTKINDIKTTIMIVDITASPIKSRKNALKNIYETSLKNNCLLVIGDFNTPYNSVHFNSYKKQFSNADREAGKGFISSWPFGIPLMQIDHIWSSKKITPINSFKKYYFMFDHPMLIVSYN
jgi:endonuclease/exonuclease/phosphatase (EEP) superfamily protein YafD